MFKSYSKTEQFRNVVKQVKDTASYNNLPLPDIRFEGTVKLHGTNAGVGYNAETGEIWAQSRNDIITPENDNFGFAAYAKENELAFAALLKDIAEYNAAKEVVIYGEWCGKGIQKKVGIAELDKRFVIFDYKVDGEWDRRDLKEIVDPCSLEYLNRFNIYFTFQFKTYKIGIDFSNPEKSISELAKITEEVEAECPVARYFGISKGVGEGVVWKAFYQNKRLCFKVKGEKHSVSKVKKLVTVDPEVLESIDKFVEYAVTENRLEQGIQEIGLAQETIGKYIGWVNKDIWEEEKDVLEKNNLTMKQVASKLSTKARNYYLDKLNKEL